MARLVSQSSDSLLQNPPKKNGKKWRETRKFKVWNRQKKTFCALCLKLAIFYGWTPYSYLATNHIMVWWLRVESFKMVSTQMSNIYR